MNASRIVIKGYPYPSNIPTERVVSRVASTILFNRSGAMPAMRQFDLHPLRTELKCQQLTIRFELSVFISIIRF